MTQGPNETLRSYTKIFTIAYADVTNPNENFAIQAFKARVANKHVHYALCGSDITDMQGLISRTQALAEVEEMRNSPASRPQSKEQNRSKQGRNNRPAPREISATRSETPR